MTFETDSKDEIMPPIARKTRGVELPRDLTILDDLHNPRFSREALSVIQAIAAAGPALMEPKRLIELAFARTGLSDFGQASINPALEVICRSLNEDANLSSSGSVMAADSLVNHLSNCLRINALLKKYPEIRQIRIERPIVITGLPRCGTTHLHNVLATDPELRTLPIWECRGPLPADDDPQGADGISARIDRMRRGLARFDSLIPHMKLMHDQGPEVAEDDAELLCPILSSYVFEHQWYVPQYGEWLSKTDRREVYEYLKVALQVLQWLRGGKRWVLKSQSHVENLKYLIETFPDAVVVFCHRNPVHATASHSTMVSYLARIYTERPDVQAIGRYWAARIEGYATAAVRDRAFIPTTQTVDVHFDEFVNNRWETIEHIYRIAKQPLSPEGATKMKSFLAENTRGLNGKVHYDLTDFGLDPDERKASLKHYSDRFGISLE